MTKFWIVLLVAVSTTALALDEAMTELDRLYFNFVSNSGFTATSPKYDGTFTAAKFWKLDNGGNPAPQPDLIYAYADVRDSDSKDLIRVAFNGTTLKQVPIGTSRAFYGIKRAPEPFENWQSWYIHFNPTQFPKTIAVDSYMPTSALNFAFPPAYKIVHPEPFVIGDAVTQIQAVAQTSAVPQHVGFLLYPSQTPLQGASPYYPGRPVDPSSPTMGFIKTEYGGSGGWRYGENAGLIGFSACNEKVLSFEGNKRYLFKACTIMVKPTTITIKRP